MTDFLVIPVIDSTGLVNKRNVRLPVDVGATGPELIALDAAILGVLDGGMFTSVREIQTDVGTPEAGIPSDGDAQREVKGVFSYQDNVTLITYQFSISGFDEALGIAGTDNIDMGEPTVADFKVGFDAVAVSPIGNAVTLLSGKLQGSTV